MTAATIWNYPCSLELLANASDPPQLSPEPPTEDEGTAICLYRKRTIAVLLRYHKLSLDTGRLPSKLGSMEFQARISSYPLHTFEDAVIFVFDVERSLKELDAFSWEIIARIVLRDQLPENVARDLHCAPRTVYRCLPEALDDLSKKFLHRGILSPSIISPKSCQEGKNGVFSTSDWKESK